MSEAYRPYTLVAELTYKCPLRCVYCSNPLDYGRHDRELDTETWLRVLREAEDLGVVQLNLTGGGPLGRDDLQALIAGARPPGARGPGRGPPNPAGGGAARARRSRGPDCGGAPPGPLHEPDHQRHPAAPGAAGPLPRAGGRQRPQLHPGHDGGPRGPPPAAGV